MLNNFYWLWDAAIPEEVCDFIISTCNWDVSEEGLVYDSETNSYIEDKKLRDTDVIWAPQMSVIGCIASAYIKTANKLAGWDYKYSSMENVQLGKYEQGGHYNWHRDTFAPNEENEQRKLSISILLNAPTEFNGGNFVFKDLKDFQQPSLKKGSILVFPSFLEHSVLPISSGKRYSAVTWVTGPAFK